MLPLGTGGWDNDFASTGGSDVVDLWFTADGSYGI
jgi:hypothetical protein